MHKSGDKTLVTNYCPISLLCIISKVLERLIYDKIIDLVACSLTLLQFGFQRGSSTLQQLLVYFHQLIISKEEIDAIYIDFHKAFHSVLHNELLIKLWNMGITGTLWRWFASYLSNRSQCVSVNSCLSNFWLLFQRSLRAVFLDSCYFLYLSMICPPLLNLSLYLLTTQNALKISTVSDIQQLQTDLDSLSDWSLRNHLSFNVSKFVFITFHCKFNSEYNINGYSLPQSTSCKDLGVIFTNTLS